MSYAINYTQSALITSRLMTRGMVNYSNRKVGGIRFIKLGRLCFSFCLTNKG